MHELHDHTLTHQTDVVEWKWLSMLLFEYRESGMLESGGQKMTVAFGEEEWRARRGLEMKAGIVMGERWCRAFKINQT